MIGPAGDINPDLLSGVQVPGKINKSVLVDLGNKVNKSNQEVKTSFVPDTISLSAKALEVRSMVQKVKQMPEVRNEVIAALKNQIQQSAQLPIKPEIAAKTAERLLFES
jgi:hypothetical protein